MRILFFISHDGFIRGFERAVQALADRGHEVHLAATGRRPALMSEVDSFEALAASHERITFDEAPRGRDDDSAPLFDLLASSRNYLRFLGPEYAAAPKLRSRAESYAPAFLPRLGRLPLLDRPGSRRLLDEALGAGLRRLPTSPALDAYFRQRDPDVALFTPLVGFAFAQHAALRSALAAGVPTALLVHSWDNLTNKGLVHLLPDRVVVWNDAQRREAVRLQRIPEERVVVTGAHSYDHWFAWSPSTSREEFCGMVGLGTGPYILYVCSSSFVAPNEVDFLRSWLRALRASDDSLLRDAGVLIRPHPQNRDQWLGVRFEEGDNVAIWPPLQTERAGARSRSDYFDSIHHSHVVVGINTSALIESAIQLRRVLTVLAPEFRDTQGGTLHFGLLTGQAGDGAGALTVGRSLDEHLGHVREALGSSAEQGARVRPFLERFVRPHGLDRPAVEFLVKAVEEVGRLTAQPSPPALGPATRRLAGTLARRSRRLTRRPPQPAPAGWQRPNSDHNRPPLRLLFFMRSINYDRHFEAALRALLERGHHIHILLDLKKKDRSEKSEVFEALRAEFGRLSYAVLPPRHDRDWATLARELRLAIDFLRYLDPAFAHADALRTRVEGRAPASVTRAARSRWLRSRAARALLDRSLRAIERALPVPKEVDRVLAELRPDAVLVTPLVGLGSPQGDYIRAAHAVGIPAALLVASWDNLTNKGVLRDLPDLTVVWNEAQAREAVELHGVLPSRVTATGAHTYDHWFEWFPSTTREDFCRKVRLDSDRPFVLYVCSSSFVAPEEATFIEHWIRRLRSSRDPLLREAGVLIRPHPANAAMWKNALPDEPGRTVVWPRQGASPTSDQRKADYYDSIYHCAAVVGINTSALVESAIIGRPVLAPYAPEFRQTQEGTLHFAHLTRGQDGGLLAIAVSQEEHERQLADALVGEAGGEESARTFVDSFLRPRGRDRAAAPLLAEAVEQLAGAEVEPMPRPLWHVAARTAVAPSVRLAAKAGPLLDGLGLRRRGRGDRVGVPGAQGKRLLLVLDHPGLLIHFDETVRALAARGNTVHLALGRPEKFEEGLQALEEGLSGLGPVERRVVIHRKIPRRRDWYTLFARFVRAAADYVHYLDPALAGAAYSRSKWRDLSTLPAGLGFLARRETLSRRQVRFLLGALRALEDAIPSDRGIERFVEKIAPDLVLVSPLVDARSGQTDYVKSARALGIATALCVTSWDNLSSKGLIRLVPDRVLVWNETQRREATNFHHVMPERVFVTGAQPFDRWFGREPATAREDFLRRVGLPPDRPYVLFVGSTRQNQSADAEPAFVRKWIAALHNSGHPELRNLAVMVRPHPTNSTGWDAVHPDGLGDGVVVWRRERPLPVRGDDRADYFDALFHCSAVVGINSSAMIEAAIIGRPVHTVRLPEFAPLQRELVHYHYLLPENGGFLREAPDLERHAAMLAEDLRDPDLWRQAQLRFVESFIRPRGVDAPATPALVETIEAAADVEPEDPSNGRLGLFPLRLLVAGLVTTNRGVVAAHRAVDWSGLRVGHSLRVRARAIRRGSGLRGSAARLSHEQREGVATVLDAAAHAAERRARDSRRWLKRRGERSATQTKKRPQPETPNDQNKAKQDRARPEGRDGEHRGSPVVGEADAGGRAG